MDLLLGNKEILQIANKVLIGLIIIICCFFFILFCVSQASLHKPDAVGTEESVASQESFQLKDMRAYVTLVASRELFRPFIFSKKKGPRIKTIDDVTKDLVLTGFVDDNEVIIKNRRTRQTYFVSVGARIGEVKITRIGDDKVEVGFNQERKELFLR